MKSWYFSHDSLGHRARAKVPLDNNDNHLTALISPKSSGRRQGIRHPRGLLATRCCAFASGSWKVMCGFQTRLQQEATKVLQFGGKQTHLNARYPDQTSISIAILLSNLKGCCPDYGLKYYQQQNLSRQQFQESETLLFQKAGRDMPQLTAQ